MEASDFHLQDQLLCHVSHICVPNQEMKKVLWEAHYRWVAGHFGIDKITAILQKYFYWPKMKHGIILYIESRLSCAIKNLQTIIWASIYHYLSLINHGILFQWTLCMGFHVAEGEMIVYMWWYIDFLKWLSW